MPDVSVVMSVYNDAQYLRQSLESILSQDGVDFEFVIIDDGSTDESTEILDQCAARDRRVRVIREENSGLTSALIRGCSEARGELIARQDADDVSLPGRLAAQASLLGSDPAVAFCSCWVQYMGPKDELVSEVRRPSDPAAATTALLDDWAGPPAHGSVMFRRAAYQRAGGYREEFYFAQDSDLWLRLTQEGRLAYAQQFLYAYRLLAENISSVQRGLQRQFGDIGRACLAARRHGQTEREQLASAARLREQILSGNVTLHDAAGVATTHYLIGAGLQKRGDVRAAGYL